MRFLVAHEVYAEIAKFKRMYPKHQLLSYSSEHTLMVEEKLAGKSGSFEDSLTLHLVAAYNSGNNNAAHLVCIKI